MKLALDPVEVQARANKGLAWLKTVGKQHGLDYRLIQSFGLDIKDSGGCALTGSSRTGASYSVLRKRLVEANAVPTHTWGWDQDHGFWVSDMFEEQEDVDEAYAMLNLAWIRALRADSEWCKARRIPTRALEPTR